MRRFDFTFTEEERIAYLLNQKEAPHLGAFFEVLLASGQPDDPADPLCEALQQVIDDLDISHSDTWQADFKNAKTLLLAEGDKQVDSLLFTVRRKRDGTVIPFFFYNQMCHGVAINFDLGEWRLNGFSTLTEEELASYKSAEQQN